MKFPRLSANGAALYQPGAAPQDRRTTSHRGLKARASLRSVGSGLQPSGACERLTLGGAQGWYEAGALPLGEAASDALDAESVGVGELDQNKLTPLLRLKYNDSIADAVADLGKPAEIGTVFAGFQRYLYEAAP